MAELVLLIALGSLANGQQLDFIVSRRNINKNLLTFHCEDTNGAVSNPTFFRYGIKITVTPSADHSYFFNINRMLEGNFSCGRGNTPESNVRTLIAFPDDRIEPVNKGPFRGDAGSTIRLNCSITPGELVEQYYGTWRSASNSSMVFYQSFPPHLNLPVINRDSQRYSVDLRDFSLSIHNVTPADGAQDYVCVLGVEDTVSITRTLIYSRTESFNLSVIITNEVANLNPIALENGGFLFEVELKTQLHIPVRLMFLYFRVGSDESANFTSEEQFINTVLITHVASEERVPFDRFRVKVALVYQEDQQEPLVGPSFGPNRDFSRAGFTPLNIAFMCITVTLLCCIAFLILLILIVCCFPMTASKIRAKFSKVFTRGGDGQEAGQLE